MKNVVGEVEREGGLPNPFATPRMMRGDSEERFGAGVGVGSPEEEDEEEEVENMEASNIYSRQLMQQSLDGENDDDDEI
ncbi:hypothetical protein BC936DRAFT_137930 [Jimgerdemannia flammicorona]|uniref:Uncharacterized protein n=2 Tax=Jimgerdemannia flammicorona TaxID=994334 RepID=A0A433CWD5_9FUNG|nr:hypothetical protein BC936DRAFT_137930 [Jimgerdemannia flammicorona]RUS24335.1 hypothetical protein BC938DRAFT_473747 [Jimgerdemannia flammicorona]